MGDLLNYESANTTIVELLDQGIHFSQHLLKHFNIHQGQSFPVIAQSDNPMVHVVKWGIENPIISDGPELIYIFGPSIEKQESLKRLCKHQRVLIPVNKYVHHRQDNEPDLVITHPQNQVLWMAGIWHEGSDGEKGFALITQNSVEEQRDKIRRIPVFLMHKTLIHQWLDRKYTYISDISGFIDKQSQPYAMHKVKDLVVS